MSLNQSFISDFSEYLFIYALAMEINLLNGHWKFETKNEPRHDKTNKMRASSKDSDQLGHPPSLIRVCNVRIKKPWVLNYPLSAQRRLSSVWADAEADLSLRWAHTHFVGFVMAQMFAFKDRIIAFYCHCN